MFLRRLLPPTCAAILTATAAFAADPLKTSVDALGYTWTPVEGLTVNGGGGPSEVGPDPRFPDRNIWKSPTILPGKGSPAAAGRKIEIKHERDWVEEHRDGTIKFERSLTTTGNKLTVSDEWSCKPTEGAFVTKSFTLKLDEHPEMEFSLIGAKEGARVENNKAAEFLRNREQPWGNNAYWVIADGVELRNVGGGTVRIKASRPLKIEWLYDDNDNATVRFMEKEITELKSGELEFELEYTQTGR